MKLWNINFFKINKEYTFIGKCKIIAEMLCLAM